ncbi:UNVERIFIED_CONTAM: hypothetical protein FKN15_037465 [Acipenser sinensis]
MTNEDEQRDVCTEFYSTAGIPGVIGAIDCTHIRIPFHRQYKDLSFINRYSYMSINCQMVCDHHLRICNVVARWAGSTHAQIFENSRQQLHFQEDFYYGVLLADKGYSSRKYLLTPVLNLTSPAELK